MGAEFPGVPTEEEEEDIQVVPDEPSPEFEDLGAAALENASINTDNCICATQAAANAAATVAALYPTHNQPCLIKADPDKIVYNITFELPNAGLLPMADKDVPPGSAEALRILGHILRNLTGV